MASCQEMKFLAVKKRNWIIADNRKKIYIYTWREKEYVEEM